MSLIEEKPYLTATSLTARQINRRVILNIIHRHQPISRADTARHTGLQRSTVSLIVDELIREGWIVEGEYGRIPRGRRPIYLQMNSAGARLLGLHISEDGISAALADLNGTIVWTGNQALSAFSEAEISNALRPLSSKIKEHNTFPIKGVGVAIDSASANNAAVKAAVEEAFGACTEVDSVALACGEWFMLNSKDAKQANGHLVSIHADKHIETGVIIGGRPLRGAHGKAGAVLNGDIAARAQTVSAEDLADRLVFAVAAYDPGLILITGPMADSAESIKPALEKRLRDIGAPDDVLRIAATGSAEDCVYLKGAVALILNHFLSECPV